MCFQVLEIEYPDGSTDSVICSNSGPSDDCTVDVDAPDFHETHTARIWWATSQQ